MIMEYYKNLDLADIHYFCDIDDVEKIEQWKDVLGKIHGMTGIKGYDNSNSINIIQMDLLGNFIKEFPNAKQASEILKIDGSAITKVCKGKRNKCGGFKWKYKNLVNV